MTQPTDENGLTETEREAAERTELRIQELRDQSYDNIRLQNVRAAARRQANLINSALRNK